MAISAPCRRADRSTAHDVDRALATTFRRNLYLLQLAPLARKTRISLGEGKRVSRGIDDLRHIRRRYRGGNVAIRQVTIVRGPAPGTEGPCKAEWTAIAPMRAMDPQQSSRIGAVDQRS